MDYFSNTYFNLKNAVIKAERRILKELGFCVHVKHPHKIIITYLQILDSEKNTNLAKKAWNLMNDSLQTDVFVRFTPEKIACACIFLAARLIKVNLPVRPPWWQLFGAEVEEIEEISLSILKLYARPRRNISKLEATVGKAKKLLLEKKGKPPVTSESGSFTPAHVSSSVVNSTGSSSAPVRPSSKAGSPQEKSLSNGAVKYSAAMERDGIRSSEVSRSQNSSRPAKRSASQSPDRSLVAKRRSHSVSDYSSQSESESSSPERPSKKYAKQHADYEKRLPSKVVVQDRFVVAMDKDSVKENDLRSQRHGKGRSPVRLDRRVSPSLRKEKHRDKYADAKTSKLRRPQKVHR